MQNVKAITGWTVLVVILAFYIYGNILGLFYPAEIAGTSPSSETQYKIPEPLDVLVKTMSLALVTNIAAILGFSISQPLGPLAGKVGFGANVPNPISFREQIQLWAAVIYGVVVAVSFAAWILHYDIHSEKTIPLAPFVILQAKSFIAILVGYVAFILSRM